MQMMAMNDFVLVRASTLGDTAYCSICRSYALNPSESRASKTAMLMYSIALAEFVLYFSIFRVGRAWVCPHSAEPVRARAQQEGYRIVDA
jgi:hypothetical protein